MRVASQKGFTYLAVLFLIAILSAVSASVGILWSAAIQREKERELIAIGNQFRRAICQYYEKSPGTLRSYPKTIKDLLKDERQLATQRYLRKIYIDPMTRSDRWGVITAPDGGVMGVHSLSEKMSYKRRGFGAMSDQILDKSRYSDWEFAYSPPPPLAPVLMNNCFD